MRGFVTLLVLTVLCVGLSPVFGRDLAKKSSEFHIYRSANNGASWEAANIGPPLAKRVNALAIDGSKSYAGTDEGIFVSSDGGRTWSRASARPFERVQSLLINRGTVYAGTARGVYVSRDQGSTWSGTLRGPSVRALATDGPIVYAGTDKDGVYASTGADRWRKYGEGLPEHSQVFDLAATSSYLYAALYANGLYRTGADGRWRKVGEVRPLEVVARGDVIVAGHNPGGIQQSLDSGKTWKAGAGLSGPAPIWVLAEAGSTLFAGTTPGAVVRSEDAGASWLQSALGLPSGAAVIAITGNRSITLAAIVVQED